MKPLSESLQEYARGIAGGLIFSLPLLYTMEVWWLGFTLNGYHLLIYIIVTFFLLIGYNRYAGMHEDATWQEVIIDSVEEIGIGFIISLIVLWNLDRINISEMGFEEIMGKIIVETMTVAIGVSVGTAQLGSNEKKGQKKKDEEEKDKRDASMKSIIVLSVCGSILIAGNVAPTEEIQMIAFDITPVRVLFIAIESLILGAIILFFSNFKGTGKIKTRFFKIVLVTSLVYVIALASAAFMLWFFGRFSDIDFNMALYQVIVLGLPAMLGASAGRLLIK